MRKFALAIIASLAQAVSSVSVRLENSVMLNRKYNGWSQQPSFPRGSHRCRATGLELSGLPTQVILGDNNVLRESVTINLAT